MNPSVVIGNFGCTGVDTDAWQAENRVKLYPGQVNRWLLVRTLRDNPTADQVRQTLNAVMSKWFDGIGIDPGLAEALGSDGMVPGVVDGIRILASSKTPLTLDNVAERREELPTGPMPFVNGSPNGVLYLSVEFNYRGLLETLPWPVRTAPGLLGVQLESAAVCPINADWMLLMSGKPIAEAPPEKGWSDVFIDKANDVIIEPIQQAAHEYRFPIYFVGAMAAGTLLLMLKKEFLP